MQKFQRLLLLLKRSYICYYIICMTVPLKAIKKYSAHPSILNIFILNNFILQNFNKCILDGRFPDQLKKQMLALSLKKETITIKPTILPALWKIYERLIYNQINQMTQNVLSIFQCDFRKKYSIQHALITVFEKARKILDKVDYLALF